jgi:hypothetical protein
VGELVSFPVRLPAIIPEKLLPTTSSWIISVFSLSVQKIIVGIAFSQKAVNVGMVDSPDIC